MLTLEVQICTFGQSGIDRVAAMFLPQLEGVTYLVSLQNPDKVNIEIPAVLQRPDIVVHEHYDKGLSSNRNYAIEQGNADILLIADDDLIYSPEGLKDVIKVFETDSTLDFATFKHVGGDNKQFPEFSFPLESKNPKGYYISSIEIALRRKSLPSDLRFSTQLGIGAPRFACGEESVFVWQMLCRGLKGRFFPIVVASHPDVTTGNRSATNPVLQGQGVWLWIRYGWFEGYLRLLCDIPRRKASLWKSFMQMTKGFVCAHKHFNRDGSDKSAQSALQ